MPVLYFDVVTLAADGIHVAANGGTKSTFEQLGLSAGAQLVLHAAQIRVSGAPSDRSIKLITDRLVCDSPLHLANPGARPNPASTVEIWAQRIDGVLDVRTQGRKGKTGGKGGRGTKAEWKMVNVPRPAPEPGDDTNGPIVKPPLDGPRQEPVLTKAAGQGRQGHQGGQGETGPTITIRYVEAATTPRGTSLGGDGGDGGPGGPGGDGGPFFDNGPAGIPGVPGVSGAPGFVSIQRVSSSTSLWQAYINQSPLSSSSWAGHELAVAEYHYRTGTAAGLNSAQQRLGVLAARPGAYGSMPQIRARRLLQQLFEHNTFLGLPRDLDVVPDRVFAAQDNQAILGAVLTILGGATTVAGTQSVQRNLAEIMSTAAKQTANALEAADTRIQEATEHLTYAMSATDVAQGRITNLDKMIDEVRKAIEKDEEDRPFWEVAFSIAKIGVSIAGAVAGIATGIGAVAAVGAGFAVLSTTADQAVDMWDMVEDIKSKLEDPAMKGFIKGIGDLTKGGERSIFHIGKIVEELDKFSADHPADKIRELARLQRERVLLLTEVGLHKQMEKEAQLGLTATNQERAAIAANKTLAEDLAVSIDRQQAQADPVLRTFLTSARQLLDMLAVRLFYSLRAREIYLGEEQVDVVRHDLGRLHPDVDRVLSQAQQVSMIQQQMSGFAMTVIEWSSLFKDMASAGALSQSPAPFVFSTDDPVHLQSLKAEQPTLAFGVPIEDVTELNGSQIFEARFDRVEITFVGARIRHGASVDSVLLKSFGHWSLRRRPEQGSPTGSVKTFAMPQREVQLTAVADGNAVRATYEASINPGASPPDSIWGRGIAANWQIVDEGSIDFSDVARVEVAFIARALSGPLLGGRAAGPRLLRPLAGWPPAAVDERPPTPIPPRGLKAVGYAGAVTAVGAGLL